MHPTAAQGFGRDLEGKLADSVRPAAEALIEEALTPSTSAVNPYLKSRRRACRGPRNGIWTRMSAGDAKPARRRPE